MDKRQTKQIAELNRLVKPNVLRFKDDQFVNEPIKLVTDISLSPHAILPDADVTPIGVDLWNTRMGDRLRLHRWNYSFLISPQATVTSGLNNVRMVVFWSEDTISTVDLEQLFGVNSGGLSAIELYCKPAHRIKGIDILHDKIFQLQDFYSAVATSGEGTGHTTNKYISGSVNCKKHLVEYTEIASDNSVRRGFLSFLMMSEDTNMQFSGYWRLKYEA